MSKELKVGETIRLDDGNIVKAVRGGSCDGCFFHIEGEDCHTPDDFSECTPFYRNDKTAVIFQLIKGAKDE